MSKPNFKETDGMVSKGGFDPTILFFAMLAAIIAYLLMNNNNC